MFTGLELNASLFEAAVSHIRSTLCAIWENNFEISEKLFSIIQVHSSIYIHFLKPLQWNIHELWSQELIVMKIRKFRKNSSISSFLALQFTINWLLKVMWKWTFTQNYCWLNPVVSLLTAKIKLVYFKSSTGETFISCYLFIVISYLKGYSCLKHIRCFARFGTICTI